MRDKEEANSFDELIEYFNTMCIFFFKKMFRADVESEEVDNILNYFMTNTIYFEQLQCVSKKFEYKPSFRYHKY